MKQNNSKQSKNVVMNIRILNKISKALTRGAEKGRGMAVNEDEMRRQARGAGLSLKEVDIMYISAMFLKLRGVKRSSISNPYFTSVILDMVYCS